MRLAVLIGTRYRIGGVETYVERVIPALVARGHDVAFLYESDGGAGHQTLQIGSEVPQWHVGQRERATALESLCNWKPDFIFLHTSIHDELRAGLLNIAPVIFFAHDFYSMCRSGMPFLKCVPVRKCSLRHVSRTTFHGAAAV